MKNKVFWVSMIVLCLSIGSCNRIDKEIDLQRLKALLSDTSVLNKEEDDEIINAFGNMIDRFGKMPKTERNELFKTEEGKEYFEVYFATVLYLGAKVEYGGKNESIKPFTSEQKSKVIMLLKEYENNPIQYEDIIDESNEDIKYNEESH